MLQAALALVSDEHPLHLPGSFSGGATFPRGGEGKSEAPVLCEHQTRASNSQLSFAFPLTLGPGALWDARGEG